MSHDRRINGVLSHEDFGIRGIRAECTCHLDSTGTRTCSLHGPFYDGSGLEYNAKRQRTTTFVAISDTHLHPLGNVPEADVLIHAGDLCIRGIEQEFIHAIDDLAALPHKYKVYVPGNHDRFAYDWALQAHEMCKVRGIEMLVDRNFTVNGVTLFGSPWTRLYGSTAAYMYKPDDEKYAYRNLRRFPGEIDVLITHSPPLGILDERDGNPLGSAELRKIIWQKLRPRFHVFGHIHDGHGQSLHHEWGDTSDGQIPKVVTDFFNVCRCEGYGDPVLSDVYCMFALTKTLDEYDPGAVR